MEPICQNCGKTINRRSVAHVWKDQTVVCTQCRNKLRGEEQRQAAYIRLRGVPDAPWLVYDGTRQHGPYSTQQLTDMLCRRQVDFLWLIWREGMAKWSPAAQMFTIPELSDDGKCRLNLE